MANQAPYYDPQQAPYNQGYGYNYAYDPNQGNAPYSGYYPQQQPPLMVYPPPQAPPAQYGGGVPPPPPNYYLPPENGGAPPKVDYGQGSEKYNATPVYRDLWAAILFLTFFVSFIVYSILSIRSLPTGTFSNNGAFRDSQNFFSLPTIVCFLIVAAAGILLSGGYVLLMQAFPKPMIIVSFWAAAIAGIATGAYYIYRGLYWAGGLALVFGILYAAMWFYFRHRVPFATLMLTTVVKIMRQFPATLVLGFVFLIIHTVFAIWWIVTFTSSFSYMKKFESCRNYTNSAGRPDHSCSNGALIGVIIYLALVWYWVSQIISNVLHTTVAGVFATHYFFDGTLQGYPTTNPTLSALKRAATNSFGSICLGSLVVAILQTIRGILQTLISMETDGALGGFLSCCVGCILGMIQGLVEFFNKYAYVEVAMYGKAYIPAAKDTWRLIKDRGIDALINDDLVENVLWLGGLLIGVVCAIIGYAYMTVASPMYNSTGSFTPAIVLVSFFIGLSLFFIAGKAVDSGNATTFVCLAEDPGAMQRSKPVLFEEVRQRYPHVVNGLQH
ncbi:pH nine-sensitive protein 1 [Dispira simplex]|nr:pH nine-sensitive protein 1 [Dispira simplex]